MPIQIDKAKPQRIFGGSSEKAGRLFISKTDFKE